MARVGVLHELVVPEARMEHIPARGWELLPLVVTYELRPAIVKVEEVLHALLLVVDFEIFTVPSSQK